MKERITTNSFNQYVFFEFNLGWHYTTLGENLVYVENQAQLMVYHNHPNTSLCQLLPDYLFCTVSTLTTV